MIRATPSKTEGELQGIINLKTTLTHEKGNG